MKTTVDYVINQAVELANKRKARVACIVFLIVIGLLLFIPLLRYPDPPPGQEGILVSFGQPEMGMEDLPASAANQPEQAEEEEAEPEPEPEPETEPVEETEAVPPPEAVPVEPEVKKEVIEDTRADEIALEKKKEEEKKKREQAEAERLRREKAEADRKLREAEEAERKRQEEAARKKKEEADKLKNQIGDLFKDDGSGRGTGGDPGNQGDPSGGDSDILSGISTGSGRVGGGLGNRGGSGPPAQDNSQETGRVVIRVCVNSSGQVVEADFTQKGSTTTSRRLVDSAVKNARQWKFSSGSVDKQCGTITYDFKVR